MDTKMANAVVVATIVNTTMSEAGFRQHMVEQLRDNERSLLDKLADADGDANVVTAVLNVDEFLAYLIRSFPKTVDAAFSNAANATLESAAPELLEASVDSPVADAVDAVVDTAKMSEGEFMDYVLAQLEAGEIPPMVRFPDNDWDEDWDEDG